MKKKILVNFFSKSKKWPRRVPKIKKLTAITINKMQDYFDKKYYYNINLILSDKKKLKKLNKKYKNKYKDTDVLTFVSKSLNKNLGKIYYCDIFFSIDEIESFIKKNNIVIYDHFNHLLVHSLLHINGYDHKKTNQFEIMKNEEIKILQQMGLKNPYLN